MSSALSQALTLLEDSVTYAFDIPPVHLPETKKLPFSELEPNTLLAAYRNAHDDLSQAVRLLKLGVAQASLDRRQHGSLNQAGSDDASAQAFATSLFTVSLLQLAADLKTALGVGERLIMKLSTQRSRKIWLPKLTREWFKSYPTPLSYDAQNFNIEQFGMSE